MCDLSIVLPTRNRADQLLKALMGIERNTRCSHEVIVIDGASTDATNEVLMLAGSIMGSWLRVVREGTCVGFGAACNKGVRLARGNHVAILHDDSHPIDGALDRAVSQLDRIDDPRTIVALYARPDASMEIAHDRIVREQQYAVGHFRGTLIAEYPIAPRAMFAALPFDDSFKTSAAIVDWSFGAWDIGARILPAIDAVLEEHFTEGASTAIDQAELDRVISLWNLPAASTTFDAAMPCRLRGRRSNAIAA